MGGGVVDYLGGGVVVVLSTYLLCRVSRVDVVLRQLNVAFLCLGLALVVMAIPYLGRFLEMLAAAFLGLAAYAVRAPNRLGVVRWRMLVVAVFVAVGMVVLRSVGFVDVAFFGYVGGCLVMFVAL